MKTITQNADSTNGQTNLSLLALGLSASLLLCGPKAHAAGPGDPSLLPFAVKFLDRSSDRMGSDRSGLYLDSEFDVMALSLFNFSTREKKLSNSDSRNRKIWIDLRYENVPETATLPRGFFDGHIQLKHLNDDALNCVPSEGISPMKPGDPPQYRGILIEFTDSQSTLWRLNFGNYVCGSVFSPCRAVLTALADLDGDSEGYADLWTIEPEPGKDSEAILLKLNKKQQWELWGSVSVPFKLVFGKEEFAADVAAAN